MPALPAGAGTTVLPGLAVMCYGARQDARSERQRENAPHVAPRTFLEGPGGRGGPFV